MINRQIAEASHHRVALLGDVVDFLDSKRRPVTESDRKPGPYPYYGANGIQGSIDDFIFDEPLVLLAEDGGHFDNPGRGIAYSISGPSWVNNHAHVIRPKSGLDLSYLCRILENYDVRPYITGTTRGKLTKAGASNIPIPVPPLDEQRRIAAILDKADALRQKRKRAIAVLDSLTRSLFLEMFGDPISNPERHPVEQVGAITDCIVPGRDKPKSFTGPIPWITTGEMVLLGETRAEHAKAGLSVEEIQQVRARTIPAGSVLLSCVGDLGKTSIAGENMVINQQLHSFQCSAALTAEYLMHALIHQVDYMRRMATKTILPYMNKSVCNSIPVQVPPIEVQREFSKQVARINLTKAQSEKLLCGNDELFASLRHRAFSGQL